MFLPSTALKTKVVQLNKDVKRDNNWFRCNTGEPRKYLKWLRIGPICVHVGTTFIILQRRLVWL